MCSLTICCVVVCAGGMSSAKAQLESDTKVFFFFECKLTGSCAGIAGIEREERYVSSVG